MHNKLTITLSVRIIAFIEYGRITILTSLVSFILISHGPH